MGDDAVLQFERRVGRVVGGGLVALPGLVPALGDVGGAEAGDGLHLAEETVEDVAPVAEHVDDDAAAVGLAVVPRGALRGRRVAFEDPVAEFAAHGENPPEEAGVLEQAQLLHPRQPQLVLHDAVLDAGRLGAPVERERIVGRGGDGLLAVDVLARVDGAHDVGDAAVGGLGVEVDGVGGVGEGAFEVGRPAQAAGAFGEGGELVGVAPDEDGVGEDRVLRPRHRHAALRADRHDRAHQVLVGAHAPGDAVHENADAVLHLGWVVGSWLWSMGRESMAAWTGGACADRAGS